MIHVVKVARSGGVVVVPKYSLYPVGVEPLPAIQLKVGMPKETHVALFAGDGVCAGSGGVPFTIVKLKIGHPVAAPKLLVGMTLQKYCVP